MARARRDGDLQWIADIVAAQKRGRGVSTPHLKRASGITLGKVVGVMLTIIAVSCVVSSYF